MNDKSSLQRLSRIKFFEEKLYPRNQLTGAEHAMSITIYQYPNYFFGMIGILSFAAILGFYVICIKLFKQILEYKTIMIIRQRNILPEKCWALSSFAKSDLKGINIIRILKLCEKIRLLYQLFEFSDRLLGESQCLIVTIRII